MSETWQTYANSDYSQNVSVPWDVNAGKFAQTPPSKREQEGSVFRFGLPPNGFDSASIDSMPSYDEATQETLKTDLAGEYTETDSDEEYLAAMIHNDIVISMAPVEEYSIEVIIDTIETAEPIIVNPEDLFRVGEK